MKDIHHWGKEGPAQTGAGLAEAVEALREIAREQSAETATVAADRFQSIARSILAKLDASKGADGK